MKNKILLFIILIIGVKIAGQIGNSNTTKVSTRDPFFSKQNNNRPTPTEKINLIHSDFTAKKPDLYEGNTYASGNVKLEHKGSILTADLVILYQEQNFVKAIGNVVLVTADGNKITSGEMEYDGNSKRGIARHNVVLTDPKQTIKTETLYYDGVANTAYFDTGGTITQGGNVMYTNTATYHINEKRNSFAGNYTINNPDYRVEGNNIEHYSATNTAEFFGPTYIFSKKNPSNFVYTEKGLYMMTEKDVFLNKNSRIHYNDKILTGDKMFYNQISGFGKATGNVTLFDPKEKRYIKGGYGEVYEKKDSAMITDKPYAVKILTKDSIYISAERIISYQKLDSNNIKKSHLRAYRKARIYKSNVQGRSDSLSFNETDGELHFIRKPIFWSGEKQITGDEIRAYFNVKTEHIDSLKVLGNAFAISKSDSLNLKDEFDQVKGRVMHVYYENNEIKWARVIGNAQAINYIDETNEKTKEKSRIGVALTTCGEIEANFEEKKIQVISCNLDAMSDTYPMSLIPKEKRFFPEFNWNTKDRIRKWRDIFLDSPNYPETVYNSDNSLFENAEKKRKQEEEKNKPKQPTRVRKE